MRGASVQAGSLCEPACERVGAVRCLRAAGCAKVGSAWRAPLSLAGMRPRKALFERRTTMCFRPAEVSMKVCPECGKNNKPVATVCEACGADLAAGAPAPGAPTAPAAPGAPAAPSSPVAPAVPGAPKPPVA